MKKIASLALLSAVLLTLACGNKNIKEPQAASIETPQHISGDSLRFGLACDGSNDTILVVLRNIYGNPDTFNILDATRRHHVFGHPSVGDRIALYLDTDSTTARMAVDLDQLCGQWCYEVRPTLRKRADITAQMQQQFLKQMPDSLRDSLFAPREYGFTLKPDGTARPIGMHFETEETPVEYPAPKRYGQWYLHNGQLILSTVGTDSLGNHIVTGQDTATFVRMRRDTLVLRFADGDKGFYRKNDVE